MKDEDSKKAAYGGVIHTYRKYDPQRFPLPSQSSPDAVSPAFEHLMVYGSLRQLTDAELAEAIEIDPSQIAGLGPSLEALIAMLEERKRRILQTYETDKVRKLADEKFHQAARQVRPPKHRREEFQRAIGEEQIVDLERIWYRSEQRGEFARQLVMLMELLGDKYQIEELAAKYAFTGRQGMSIDKALEVKEELETIDRLLEQLREAMKDAKVYLINMEDLARFAETEQLQELSAIQNQVAELLQRLAEQQGLMKENGEYRLTPKAYRLFQNKLLDRIFSDLQAGRSGRHHVDINGHGAVELQRTKPYEFGDSPANMDIPSSMINAMVRGGPGLPIRMAPEDIEIHLTRNSPKCATVVCMDMSGSMRWGMQYVNVKRMALALHGLIRTEYPGDFIDFVEVCTLPKRRHISEVPQLLPRPVTVNDPWVRLKVDMSRENVSEWAIPPHFTNIQHGLRLARQLLTVQDTPNRQVILITDGLPTAHFEGHWLYMLYPPDDRTENHTMREGMLCKQQGITINVFLLSTWAQSIEDVRFVNRLAEQTKGRVFAISGNELDRFVVWDYVRQRRYLFG